MSKSVKKLEVRDILRNKIAQLIMEDLGISEIGRSKEGLVISTSDGKDLVVRVIQKKERVEKADIVEIIKREFQEVVDEEEVSMLE